MERYSALKQYMASNGVPCKEAVPGAELTTFRTGGPVALVARPLYSGQLEGLCREAEACGVPYFILGNGSNLLIPDEGLDMLLIRLGGEFEEVYFDRSKGVMRAGAGASMAAAAKLSVAKGFMGLEWAAGIPGTVGGAIAMNAGAYGGEVKNVLRSVTVLKDGVLRALTPSEGDMGYRRSVFSYPGMVVLEAEFGLVPDDGAAKERMEEYNRRRREKQPLNYPSAGSTFKRPEGYFAGKLIEDAGLKGFRVGGAAVSEKHAGFVVNLGGATSADVLAVIEGVQRRVFDKFGVMLEPEVRILRSGGKV